MRPRALATMGFQAKIPVLILVRTGMEHTHTGNKKPRQYPRQRTAVSRAGEHTLNRPLLRPPDRQAVLQAPEDHTAHLDEWRHQAVLRELRPVPGKRGELERASSRSPLSRLWNALCRAIRG